MSATGFSTRRCANANAAPIAPPAGLAYADCFYLSATNFYRCTSLKMDATRGFNCWPASTEVQAINSFSRSSVMTTSHSTLPFKNPLLIPVQSLLVVYPHLFEMLDKAWQVTKVTPKAIKFLLLVCTYG